MNTLDIFGASLVINNLSVYVTQVVLIFSIIAIFILLKKYQLGIIAICFYCLHWAYASPKVLMVQNFSDSERSMLMFMFLGFSFAALGVASVIQNEKAR
jgi:tryptophan-rich sensory protein